MKNFKSENGGLPSPDLMDMTMEGYIWKYYIDSSPDHGMKYPRVVLQQLGFMGDKKPLEFWMWLLEPPKDGEFKQTKGKRLVWPYVDRLAICAAKFVGLDGESQGYVLKARGQDKPIWWRGDLMENFKAAARETYRYDYDQLDEAQKAQYRRWCGLMGSGELSK
jgi:hypothetical protein